MRGRRRREGKGRKKWREKVRKEWKEMRGSQVSIEEKKERENKSVGVFGCLEQRRLKKNKTFSVYL